MTENTENTPKTLITKHPGGRPPLFKTPEEMQIVIDEYFDYCDNASKKVVNKDGEEYQISYPEPYTMSGLAYFLNMSRETLSNYKEKDKFLDTIKRARNKVEYDIERRMNDKDTFTPGLIFNTKNNFGWKDKSEVDQTVHLPKPLLNNLDVSDNNGSKETEETE